MTLGILAVGIVILIIVTLLLGWAIKSFLGKDEDVIPLALWIIIVVCLYCAISGTYLLHLAGKV